MDITERSRQVLLSCCLKNGAIIAADTDDPHYPHDVQAYRYVWPRDAAYVCYALGRLGHREEQVAFFDWLSRAEDFRETGLLFQNYYTHGRKRWLSFQPDQNGSMLWIISEFLKDEKDSKVKEKYSQMISHLADGLCRVWDSTHFTIMTQDLWEHFFTYPEMKGSFIYSLAACSCGLSRAYGIMGKEQYLAASDQMRKAVEESYNRFFPRSTGLNPDLTPDTSFFALIWPYRLLEALDPRVKASAERLFSELDSSGILHRYSYDDYDGFRFQGIDARRGSGSWPIANFFASIYLSLSGEKDKARHYYDQVIQRIDENNNIPEQIFTNSIQRSIKPLAWSHAMQVIASSFLER